MWCQADLLYRTCHCPRLLLSHLSLLKVDFQDVEVRTLAERRRQEEKQQRLGRIYKEKLEKAKQEMEGKPMFTVFLFELFFKQK